MTTPNARERFCWNCGDSMGVVQDRYYHRSDTCGKRECEREARDQERDDSREQLDRDIGW